MADRTIPNASALTGWRKSSYSGNESGSCVEVLDGYAAGTRIPVRDSKDPDGPALVFPAAAWTHFIAAVKAGRFTA